MANHRTPKFVVNWAGGSKTFYPSLDGRVLDIDNYTNNWANFIAEPGTHAYDYQEYAAVAYFAASVDTDFWVHIARAIFLFDTSSLDDGIPITSATFSLYGFSKLDDLATNPDINVYSSLPASDASLEAGDFDSLGVIAFCDTPITYAGWNITGYNDFIFNASGIAAISKTGITKLGTREATHDVGNTTPNWIASKVASFNAYFSNYVSPTTQVMIF